MKPLVMTGTAQSEPSHSATSSSVATEQIKNIPSCRHTTSNSANTETSQMKISAEPSKWQQPYYMAKGILIDQINTLSLHCGGANANANALSSAGYSDTQIQKMGHWQGATFKIYIH
jgi:hypothetical protein